MSDDLAGDGPQVIGGRFEVVRKLGAGAFGAVWLARDLAAGGAEVALKVLHARNRHAEWVLGQFEREARVLGELDHPNIARPLGWSTAGDHAFIAMEYVEGHTLDVEIADRVSRGVHFSGLEVARLIDGIAGAVGTAHEKGIVHRDLKPKNVMLAASDGAVKVLDFGIAKVLGDQGVDATTVGRLLGSLLYISPEQVKSAAVDARSDVFALGTILFELLTLRKAWARDAGDQPITALDVPLLRDKQNSHLAVLRRITMAPRPRPSASRPDLGAGIDALVTAAMAIAPAERPGSVAELASRFRALVEEDGPEAEPTGFATSPGFEIVEVVSLPADTPVGWAGIEAEDLAAEGSLVVPSPLERPAGEASYGSAPRAAPVAAAPAPQVSPPVVRRWAWPVAAAAVVALAGALLGIVVLDDPAAELEASIELPPADGVASPAGSATTSVVEAPPPEPGARPAVPRPRSRGRPRVAAPRPVAPPAVSAPRPHAALYALLARARRDPPDLDAFAELSDAIIAAAAKLPRDDDRLAIKRRATAATMTVNSAELADALERLVRAEAR